MSRIYTDTSSTSRQTVTNGQPGAWQSQLTGLSSTPILSDANGELMKRFKIDTPVELFQTYLLGVVDVVQGDRYTQGGITYNVKAVQVWPNILGLSGATQLIVERVWTA